MYWSLYRMEESMPLPKRETDITSAVLRRAGVRTDVKIRTLYALPRNQRGSAYDPEDYPQDQTKTPMWLSIPHRVGVQ